MTGNEETWRVDLEHIRQCTRNDIELHGQFHYWLKMTCWKFETTEEIEGGGDTYGVSYYVAVSKGVHREILADWDVQEPKLRPHVLSNEEQVDNKKLALQPDTCSWEETWETCMDKLHLSKRSVDKHIWVVAWLRACDWMIGREWTRQHEEGGWMNEREWMWQTWGKVIYIDTP